jgi:hypothetical protein
MISSSDEEEIEQPKQAKKMRKEKHQLREELTDAPAVDLQSIKKFNMLKQILPKEDLIPYYNVSYKFT